MTADPLVDDQRSAATTATGDRGQGGCPYQADGIGHGSHPNIKTRDARRPVLVRALPASPLALAAFGRGIRLLWLGWSLVTHGVRAPPVRPCRPSGHGVIALADTAAQHLAR